MGDTVYCVVDALQFMDGVYYVQMGCVHFFNLIIRTDRIINSSDKRREEELII